jgi:hypothetical protein
MSMRTCLALAVLIAVAAPLHAQASGVRRFDAGSFTIELPANVPFLTLVQSKEESGVRAEVFIGGNWRDVLVIMVHTWHPTSPESQRAYAATMNQSVREVAATLNDTSLTIRRALLRGRREGITSTCGCTFDESRTREIMADGRLTLRAPVTMRLPGRPIMAGTGDVSVARRQGLEGWMVLHVSLARTPERDAAAVRMLDSLHATGRPTSLPLTPMQGPTAAAATPR